MEHLEQKLDRMLSTEQFAFKELKNMFLTLTLDQFFIFSIGMLSTAMVSSVGEVAIAAVSLVGTLNGMVSLMFTSLASGGAIMVARAKGSGEADQMRSAIGEVTGLCCAVAFTLGVLLYAGADLIVNALYPGVEKELIKYAVQYMRLMSISFVPYSIFNAIFNIFRNLGDTRSSLVLTVVINVAHLLLSLLFINGLGMGVKGSGLSFIIARILGMVLALFWLIRIHNDYSVKPQHFFRFKPAVFKKVLSLGTPVAMESMLLQGGMLLVQIYLAKLTTTDIAAHAVANSIFQLYGTTSGALLAVTSTVCGQCYGAKRYDLMRKYCFNLIRVGRFIMLLTIVVLYPLTPLFMKLYKATEQGRPIVMTALSIGVAGYPILWCDSYLPAMVMRVAGDGTFTGIVSVASLALSRCALGYALAIPLGFGVSGIWIALIVEWILRAIALHLRFRKDRWLHLRDNVLQSL